MKTELKTTDGICEAYTFAATSTSTPTVGVLIYMDALGVRPALIEMAERISRAGFPVLLPNLFYRSSALPVLSEFPDPAGPEDMKKASAEFMPMMQALTPELLLRDASAYLDALKVESVAIVGYCMGGAHALRTAAQYPERVKLVASYHGGKLASDQPSSPHLLIPQIEARMYFAHADQDRSMPAEEIALLERTLEENGKDFTSELYKGVQHGFTMRDLPVFNQAALERHWESLLNALGQI